MTGPDRSAAGTGTTGSDEPVGSVAEEALKLLRALTADADHAGDADAGDASGERHVCTTTWCPVCQVVGFVRANPEAVAAVTHTATAFARSLRDLVDTALAPREES